MSFPSWFKNSKDPKAQLQTEAWVGDSILGLYVRQLLIANDVTEKAICGEVFSWFTCNQFLSAFGQPTAVEARIGRVYLEGGLGPAFNLMDEWILPTIRLQLGNRRFRGKSIVLDAGSSVPGLG